VLSVGIDRLRGQLADVFNGLAAEIPVSGSPGGTP
jgi:hypothetical protein